MSTMLSAAGEWLRWQRSRWLPCVRQTVTYDCGPAALATIARYYGHHLSVDSARELAFTDRNGTNLWYLKDGAEALGFEARPAVAIYDALSQVVPAICHFTDGTGHFVVVYQAGRTHAIVADPGRGLLRLKRAEFEKRWSGHLLVMEPGPAFQKLADSAPPSRIFLDLVLAERRMLGATLAVALAVGALGWATAAFMRVVFDTVLPGNRLGLLLPLGISLILASCIQAALQILRSYWETRVAQRIEVKYVGQYLEHLFQLPAQVLEARCRGSLHQRVAEAAFLRQGASTAIVALAGDLLILLASLALLFYYSPAIAAVGLISIPLMLLVIIAFVRPVRQKRDELSARTGAQATAFFDKMDIVRPMKVFHAEGQVTQRLMDSVRRTSGTTTSVANLAAVPAALTGLVNGITTTAVLWVGAAQVATGGLTPGQFIFSFGLLAQFMAPIVRLPNMALQLQDALALIERVQSIMSLPKESETCGTVRLPDLAGEIRLENVTFGYSKRKPVLRDISMQIRPGERIAVVGETGSGKTTLAAILAGLYQPGKGHVRFDGHDLAELDMADLRRHISAVFQKPYLFEGLVWENIALDRELSLPDIERVAMLALADDFIRQMPMGYSSMLNPGGANLSGGQQQRIGIARALLHEAPVLILDEATSSLDSGTEHEIWANIAAQRSGRTTVVMAHRLSTIIGADRVYVLADGRIVEEGTHQQLMQRRGTYYEMFRWQVENDAAGADRAANQ
ncbi:MAG: peptidase domain-containing ABC transporter [Mycobacterium leprae]